MRRPAKDSSGHAEKPFLPLWAKLDSQSSHGFQCSWRLASPWPPILDPVYWLAGCRGTWKGLSGRYLRIQYLDLAVLAEDKPQCLLNQPCVR